MDCKTCKEGRTSDVPFVVHEADMARMERTNKRSATIIILLIVLLIASWTGFLIYENQYVDVITETTQEVWQEADNGGVATNRFIGGDYHGYTAESTDDGENIPAA